MKRARGGLITSLYAEETASKSDAWSCALCVIICSAFADCQMPPLAAKAASRAGSKRFPTMTSGVSYARSDGLRIAFVQAGTGQPVVLLHGVGSTNEIWRRQMLALAPTMHCIALDYRGYGRSDVPPDPALLPDAADPQSISRS